MKPNQTTTADSPLIVEILEAYGFDSRWIRWIKSFLSSGTSAILLVQHIKGLRVDFSV